MILFLTVPPAGITVGDFKYGTLSTSGRNPFDRDVPGIATAFVISLDAKNAPDFSQHLATLKTYILDAAGKFTADTETRMAVDHGAVADQNILGRTRTETPHLVFTALHADGIITGVNVAILDNRTLHRLQVDTVIVVTAAAHIQTADDDIVRTKHVNGPGWRIAHTETFKAHIPAILKLDESRTGNLFDFAPDCFPVPIIGAGQKRSASGDRYVRRAKRTHERAHRGGSFIPIQFRRIGKFQHCILFKMQFDVAR